MHHYRILSTTWTTQYKPEEPATLQETTEVSFLSKQLSSIRKADGVDELERFLKEKPVSSDLVEQGALGWWKVSLNMSFSVI